MSKKSKDWIPLATLMVIGGMVWIFSFSRLLYISIGDLLAEISITGEYPTNMTVVIVLGILLLIGGKKAKDFIK